jgi:hypothetical protein
MQVCICMVVWALGRYDHGVYAWRETWKGRKKKLNQ